MPYRPAAFAESHWKKTYGDEIEFNNSKLFTADYVSVLPEQEDPIIMGKSPVGKMISLTEKNYVELKKYFASYQPEISLALLFGSYGTVQQRADSDLDFAVLFNTEADIYVEMRLLSGLSELLGIENIDLVNLNRASIVVQHQALAGSLIYEKDPIITSDYFEKVIKYYCDYAPVLKKFDREFLEERIEYEKY
jgi:uncharacterized protein